MAIEIPAAWLNLFHTVKMASLRASTGGADAEALADRAGLMAVLEKVDAKYRLSDDRHLIQMSDGEGWIIQHPMSCRPNLFACRWNAEVAAADVDESTPPGRYVGVIETDAVGDKILKLGERLDDDA